MQALIISTLLNLSAIALECSKVWSETHMSVSCIVGGTNSLLSEKLGFNFEVGNTALFFSLFVLLFSESCPKISLPTKVKLLSNFKVQKQKRIAQSDRNNFREQNRRAGAFYSVLMKWDFQVLRKCNCKIMSAFAINTMSWYFSSYSEHENSLCVSDSVSVVFLKAVASRRGKFSFWSTRAKTAGFGERVDSVMRAFSFSINATLFSAHWRKNMKFSDFMFLLCRVR